MQYALMICVEPGKVEAVSDGERVAARGDSDRADAALARRFAQVRSRCEERRVFEQERDYAFTGWPGSIRLGAGAGSGSGIGLLGCRR